jgi:hypothetical protein
MGRLLETDGPFQVITGPGTVGAHRLNVIVARESRDKAQLPNADPVKRVEPQRVEGFVLLPYCSTALPRETARGHPRAVGVSRSEEM